MRIVHVNDYFQPQLGYQEIYIMKAQVAEGHEVHMITSDRHAYYPEHNSIFGAVLGPRIIGTKNEIVEGIILHRLPCRFEILERTHKLWIKGLERKIAELKPDLVIAHVLQSITSWRIAKIKGKENHKYKLIFDSHANVINSKRSFRKIFYLVYRLLLAKLFMKKSDAIVAIDSNSKEFLEENCGIHSEFIRIIPLGADSQLFSFNTIARKTQRALWKVTDEDIVFIYLGKVLPKKGVHYIIDAAFELSKEFSNFTIVIVGGGTSKYIEQLKMKARSQKKVRFLFFPHINRNDIPKYYSAADVSVWPAEVSIGTLEAQSCGLPLIVGNSPILKERIAYGNGLLCKTGDINDLAAKMYELALKPEIRRKMGEKGRKAIVEEFDWKIISKKFMQLVY